MALKDDDSLWVWGQNGYGQVGNNTSNNISTPLKIMQDVDSISSGYHSSVARKKDGTIWVWGRNHKGQLGLGDTSARLEPKELNLIGVKSLMDMPYIKEVIKKYLIKFKGMLKTFKDGQWYTI